ncbi:MAG: hypothetical protein KDD53_03205, partial [Bdellovibrionales bacterium]|nr:hypothetical protein [Bdellovibrionales bacterium]
MLDKLKNRDFHILIWIAVFALYWRAIGFDFTYDDYPNIVLNNLVTSPKSIFALLFSPSVPGDLYRPLVSLSYRIQYLVSGTTPNAFHFFNITLHALTTSLLFWLLCSVLHDKKISLLISLVFGIHPINIESVASIVGRAEILSTFFGLSACIVLIRAAQQSLSVQNRYTLIGFSALLFLCSTLCKESGLTFMFIIPLVLIASGLTFFNQNRLFVTGSLVIASILSLILRYSVLGKRFYIPSHSALIFPENPLLNTTFIERLIPSMNLLGDYLILLLFPMNLSADYSEMPATFFA